MLNSSLLRRHCLSILFISFVFFICLAGAAEAQSALDGFDPNANGAVNAIVLQPDGKILIGGDFTTLSPNGGAPVTRNRIARLNSDGTLDATFNPNANGSVFAIALQPDGKVLVGGSFSGASGIGGQTRNRIARLDAVTGLADSFDPNANGTVLAIVVQADGKILVGGAFFGASSIGGQTRNSIARLDSVTGLPDSFDPNASLTVRSIAIQPDGKILVGGGFVTIGGQTRNRIARLDAVTGLADSFDPNANGQVNAIALQADGSILVGGFFTVLGGQARSRIGRLDPVSGLADSFDPSANGLVHRIVVQPDGRILVGGAFVSVDGVTPSIGGQPRNRVARLMPNGTSDSFDPNANAGTMFALALQPNGKVLAGGDFNLVAPSGGPGVVRNGIARLETDGRADQSMQNLNITGSGAIIRSNAVQPDGKILIGGTFSSVLGVPRSNLARLNPDGTLDTTFDPGPTNVVRTIAVQADGKILIGGNFITIGGQSRTRIARLDAVTGLPDSFNPTANSEVHSIVVQADGKILVAGIFSNIGGQSRQYMARLDPTTGLADTFNSGTNNSIFSMCLQPDGKIVVGGFFTAIGGQPRNYIARLDPATGLADSYNPNASNYIFSVVVQPDGKILAGGTFATIGGQTRNHIARLDAVTGLADSFDPNANVDVYSIAVQADGKILAGGDFTNIGGQARTGIARLDSVTGQADSFNANADSFIRSVAVQADGKIFAGGFFTTIGGQARGLFARLSNDTVAQQNLAVTQNAVTWTRSGSSPQFSRVVFEDSTDGVNYNFLGSGTASGSNWTLTGLNLTVQQNLFIRAHGFYRTGFWNNSDSLAESVRNAFIPGPAAISGTVTYGNAIGSPVAPRFVKNVSLASTAGSPAVGPVITGTSGTYALTGFGAGSYTIRPTKAGGSNTAVTSNDAARVAQGVSSSVPFVSLNQKFASDASGNGTVSSNDAALIARFAAGLPGTGNVGQWKFFTANLPGPATAPLPTPPYNDSRTYATVSSGLTSEDYIALLIGEASGNYNPATHPRPANGPEKSIAVQLPQIVVSTDQEILIPVSVQGSADKRIISYEFNLRYDPSVIQPLENPVDVKGTASRGLMVVANPNEPGLLRVVVYGPMPIDGDGVLLNLRFTAVGKPGSVSPLTFERIILNEGEPKLTIADGRVDLF